MNESEQEKRKLIKLGGVLGRRYPVWEGEGSSQTERKGNYIWNRDGFDEEEVKRRYDDIAWEEEYKKKCLEMMKEKGNSKDE